MTRNELIVIGKDKVRRDSNLMLIYIDLFYAEFGYKPNCAACSFNTDWLKFVRGKNAIGNQYIPIMENTTFRLKKNSSEILQYRVERAGKMVTRRKYANKMTEEFAVAFLTNGTEQELSERIKLFAVLPAALLEPTPLKEVKKRKPRTKKSK